MLHGSINHVALTVSDLPEAMAFFGPFLDFLGYSVGEIMRDERSGHELTVNVNPKNDIAINIWQAEADAAEQPFRIYAPGLHHLAFNVGSQEQVDHACELVRSLGAQILDGPAEFPFDPDGYYAVYFLGPDGLKLEVAHMPAGETRERKVTSPF